MERTDEIWTSQISLNTAFTGDMHYLQTRCPRQAVKVQLSNTDLSGVERNYRIHLLEAYDYMGC